MKAEIVELKKELRQLEKEYKKNLPIMRGSVTYMGTKNKQPYFSLSLKGKTKTIYLGDKRAKAARKYVENYKRSIEITNKMTLIRMELFKKS
jgi:hypothetical protein